MNEQYSDPKLKIFSLNYNRPLAEKIEQITISGLIGGAITCIH